MYNLYIYEKNISERLKKELQEQKAKKFRLKRKIELDKFSMNYNKRMNDFIISLCKSPIYIKDSINKESPQLISDKEKTLEKAIFHKKKTKNFSFGNFLTDKKRLKLLNEEKEINKKYEDKIAKNKLKQEERLEKEKLKNNKIIIQPRMRFKPRNDLERISEVMNLLGDNKNKKKIKILLEQLKQIDLDRIKQTQGFVKLRQLYKKKKTILEENKKKNDKNDKNNKKDSKSDSRSESSEENREEELELDYMLETNLHRKLRNMNMQIEKEKKIKEKILKERGDTTTKEDSIEKNLREKNKKLLDLFKDDEKLYFKGASQYVLNKKKLNNNDIKKKLIISNKTNNFRSISAIPIPKSRKIVPDFHNSVQFHKYSGNKSGNNLLKFRNNKQLSYRVKRPNSMAPLSEETIYKDDLIKKLDIKFQIKKKNMDKIFNNERNNSILNDLYGMVSEKEYNKLLDNPFYMGKSSKSSEISEKTIKDKDLDNKLKNKKKVIKMNFKGGILSANSAKDENEGNEYKDVKKVIKKRRKKKQEDKNKIKHNDDEVVIDGVKYKNEDIRTIADIIFTKCGYYHKKIV